MNEFLPNIDEVCWRFWSVIRWNMNVVRLFGPSTHRPKPTHQCSSINQNQLDCRELISSQLCAQLVVFGHRSTTTMKLRQNLIYQKVKANTQICTLYNELCSNFSSLAQTSDYAWNISCNLCRCRRRRSCCCSYFRIRWIKRKQKYRAKHIGKYNIMQHKNIMHKIFAACKTYSLCRCCPDWDVQT